MARPPGAGEELYLAVVLNGEYLPQLARFILSPNGQVAASAATLREIGLRWPGSDQATGLIDLARLAGLEASYDRSNQQMNLIAPVAMLDRLPLRLSSGLEAKMAPPSPPVPGLLFNYDLFAQHSGGASTLNGWSELRLFGVGPGVWSTSMTSGTTHNALGSRTSNVRLDTSWRIDWPEQALSLVVGDTVTGSLNWSRSMRIGGLRFGRNFELQPYQVTAPLSSFVGEATLPSTVDLYINGLRQSTQRVPPGQFQIDSLPSLNGVGRAELVVTDVNGQRRVMAFDFYGEPSLLKEGLWDGSVAAGVPRQGYGLKSFSYASSLVASGNARYGLSDRTTLEGLVQASGDVQVLGAGGVWRIGQLAGVLSGSVAASRGSHTSGRQASLGYHWNAHPYSVALNSTRRSGGWRDIASALDTFTARGLDAAYLGFGSGLGQFGLSFVRQTYDDKGQQRFATLSWSRPFGEATLTFNLLKDLDLQGELQAQLTFYMPLDQRRSLTAALAHSDRGSNLALGASQNVDSSAGGWGWRVQAAATEGGTVRSQAEVTQMSTWGQWMAGISTATAESSVAYGAASGSVVWMGGGIKPMRRVDDAFALVSTAGVPDVPVRLENRLVGRTDGQGLLLIPQLNAYQRNNIAIDTLDLPPDMRADSVQKDAVPASRSGTLVQFGLRRVTAVQLSLRDGQGVPLPVGTAVTLVPPDAAAAASETSVGYDGLVYLEDPPAGLTLRVDLPAGPCSAALPASLQPGWVDLGPMTCRP